MATNNPNGRPKIKALGDIYSLTAAEIKANIADSLRSHTEQQALVTLRDLHPANKIFYKSKLRDIPATAADRSERALRQSLGARYNAHRYRLLDRRQRRHLLGKVFGSCSLLSFEDSAWCCDENDEEKCWRSTLPGTQTTEQADGTKEPSRPRGVQLDRAYRYGKYFSPATDDAKGNTSFVAAAVVLTSMGRYAPGSEYEVSHLCHNPYCMNPKHLQWELHPENHARECCRHTRSLECPNCSHKWSACQHDPICVVPETV